MSRRTTRNNMLSALNHLTDIKSRLVSSGWLTHSRSLDDQEEETEARRRLGRNVGLLPGTSHLTGT